MLLPCCGSAASVELDVLADLLETVRAAFPQALSVGHYIKVMSPEKLYTIRTKLERKVGMGDLSQDSRLMTHYSLVIACVKKVKLNSLISFYQEVNSFASQLLGNKVIKLAMVVKSLITFNSLHSDMPRCLLPIHPGKLI